MTLAGTPLADASGKALLAAAIRAGALTREAAGELLDYALVAWLEEDPSRRPEDFMEAARTGALPETFTRILAGLTWVPDGEPLSDRPRRERPAAFSPPTLTVLSDPHTQAGVHSIWCPEAWERPVDGGRPYYRDKNGVMVYARDAGDLILGLDDARASALLVCLGKWFAETGGNLTWPDTIRVHVDDILAFRGIKKHTHGGYEPKQKEATKEDLLFLAGLWVRSHQKVWEGTRGGKRRPVEVDVDDPLVLVSLESTVDLWGERIPYAFRFSPGPWAKHYLGDGGGAKWTTPILRQIMRYDPRQGVGRMKMRLGIYLAFQWRIRAGAGTWEQPWKLRTLLEGARIAVPAGHPQRFFPRVLRALDELHRDGVLAVCEAIDTPGWTAPADEPPKRWVPRLLDARWRLLPEDAARKRLPTPGAAAVR